MAHPKPREEFRQQNQGRQNPQQPGKSADQNRHPNQPPKGDEHNPDRNPGGSPGAGKHGNQPGQKFEPGQDRQRDANAPKNPSVNHDEDKAQDAQRKSAYR